MTDIDLRDRLAVERTHLANERTLLAYIRTALGTAARGAALIQFLSGSGVWAGVGWLMVAGGVGLGLFGAKRFFDVRKGLDDST
jgi:putative membrane protein